MSLLQLIFSKNVLEELMESSNVDVKVMNALAKINILGEINTFSNDIKLVLKKTIYQRKIFFYPYLSLVFVIVLLKILYLFYFWEVT